jgi:hypothetical protein
MHSLLGLSWAMGNSRYSDSQKLEDIWLTSLQNDLDYLDENAERLSRQKMRSDAMKRQFAINGTLSFSADGCPSCSLVYRL